MNSVVYFSTPVIHQKQPIRPRMPAENYTPWKTKEYPESRRQFSSCNHTKRMDLTGIFHSSDSELKNCFQTYLSYLKRLDLISKKGALMGDEDHYKVCRKLFSQSATFLLQQSICRCSLCYDIHRIYRQMIEKSQTHLLKAIEKIAETINNNPGIVSS